MKSTSVATLLLLSSLALPAAVPLRWTVETSRLQPVVFDVVRGETLALEASFQSYGTPLAMTNHPAGMFLQTNGMASSWWTYPASAKAGAPSVLKATFAPSMDPGAGTLTGFIGATGEIYRAAFTLRFRNGPGRTPNALPLPTPVIDCEKVTFLNPESAPFSGGGGTDTNAVKALIESETRGTNTLLHTDFPMSEAWTNGVAAVVTNDVGGFTPWTTGNSFSFVETIGTPRYTSITNAEVVWTGEKWKVHVVGHYLIADPFGSIEGVIDDWQTAYNRKNPPNTNASRDAEELYLSGTLDEVYYYNFLMTVPISTRAAIPPRNALGLAYARDVPSTNGFVTAAVTNAVAAEVRTKATFGNATNAAEAVVGEVLDYALTNLTGAAVRLASGQVGNVTLSNVQTNLALSLDFSSNTNRSGDCLLLAFCGSETTLAVGPSQAVDVLGTYDKLKAGTNLVMVTRMMMRGTNSVVMVNVKEVK